MIDESSLMAMQMAAIQCVQEELSTLRAECDALRTVYEATMDFVGAQGTPYEADQYLMLNGVLGAYHARTADAKGVAPSATDVLFPGAA
jgi:hypothetical protein